MTLAQLAKFRRLTDFVPSGLHTWLVSVLGSSAVKSIVAS
jgi:hypothetical protein